jgi:hypothetical protein
VRAAKSQVIARAARGAHSPSVRPAWPRASLLILSLAPSLDGSPSRVQLHPRVVRVAW